MNIDDLGVDGIKYGFRPESAVLSNAPTGQHYSIRGFIATREMLGSETVYQVKHNNSSYMIKCIEDNFSVDQEVCLEVAANKIFFFEANGNRIGEEDGRFNNYLEALKRG